MKIRRQVVTAFAVLASQIAVAHSISDEVGVGTSQSSPRNPRSGFVYDTISGLADASDVVALRFGITLTHDQATQPAQGAQFADTGGNIAAGMVGLDWSPSEHVPLAFEINASPKSSSASDASITFDENGSPISADALLRSTSRSLGFALSAGYETAGDSDYETATNGSFSVTHFNTVQNIAAFQGASGLVDSQRVIAACGRSSSKGCRQLTALFRARPADINQFRVSALISETLFVDTDLTLNGAYYFYDQDPTQVGYFTLASFGRTALGAGVPIAPLNFTVRPEVAHRFGALSINLSYQYVKYVTGEGYANSVGLKIQYKFSKVFKMWITGNGQNDVDAQGDSTKSSTLALGARYSF